MCVSCFDADFPYYVAAREGAFARELLIGIGLLSMAVAAVFMAGQRDFKRMLAYSSVEHMGILVVGIGVGGLATLRFVASCDQQCINQNHPFPISRKYPPLHMVVNESKLCPERFIVCRYPVHFF